MAIKVLPEEVANKIAAGEVIERPASVVKEFVENSLDAGAGRIEIDLEEGGARLIRVADDGCGMSPEDTELAFLSHATSKLPSADDLFSIKTLGFRGEALPSVGAASKARLVSRTADSAEGTEIECIGGQIGPARACGAPVGTLAEARELFFNLPVRRKFLRSAPTELSHISNIITRVALSFPTVQFVLRHNERRVYNLAPAESPAERVAAFFGEDMAGALLPVEACGTDCKLSGFILPPEIDRPNSRTQYFFVNSRYVRDATLSHAVAEAYRGLLAARRYPVVFLFLEVAPELVDVNVHPTKIEVRFRDKRSLHNHVYRALRDALRSARYVPASVPQPRQDPETPAAGGTFEQSRKEAVRQALNDFFSAHSHGTEETRHAARGAGLHAPTQGEPIGPQLNVSSGEVSRAQQEEPAQQVEAPRALSGDAPPRRFFQVHDSYIVEETEDGINIIDQHALHESLLYSQIRERVAEAPLRSQRLLVPEVVELSAQEYQLASGLMPELGRLGFELDEFGSTSIVIRAFPQMLERQAGPSFFRDLLAELAEAEMAPGMENIADHLIKAMACKGAVKAGQRLSPNQMRALLERRDKTEQTLRCPHGRPTTISLTLKDLEREFHR